MADIDSNSDLVSEVTSHVEMNGNNEEDTEIDQGIEVHVSDDEEMLQNALVGNGTFSEVQTLLSNGIRFINEAGTGDHGSADQVQATFVSESSTINFINDSNIVQQSDVSVNTSFVDCNGQSNEVAEQRSTGNVNSQFVPNSDIAESQSNSRPSPSNSAPLGSSQNPIRIIQQGNQYTPVQQLSTEQLQQIMQVVQQQQLTKNAVAGSSVLFNPQTNTRIVYRVIYPSQLHKDEVSTSEMPTPHFTPKRTYKRRNKDEELERIEGPELTKEEKEQRKKMRPKTRSGRISKPPKHMVKDFKHIHVLDYDEDYDDSDGGYSDFKYEEEEEEVNSKDDDESFFVYAAGVDSVKPKNWKCTTCGKAYIGRAGLARHLRLHTDHGSIDPDGEGDMEPPDPNSVPSVSAEENSMPATPNGINSTANSTGSFSEDSRDSSVSMTYTPTPRPRGRGRGRPPRGLYRGRGAYGRVDPEVRRINKLKEITRECSDEELMEIVLPRLAKVITLWEFLLMKVEKGNPAWPHADDIYHEYEKLHQHVKNLCREYLQFVAEPGPDQQKSLLQVDNVEVAQALGLQIGPYKVKDISDTDTELRYRYKGNPTVNTGFMDHNSKPVVKRTVEVVSPNLMVSPAKKLKPALSPVTMNLSSGQLVNFNSSTTANKVITVVNSSASSGVGAGETKASPFISKIKILSPSSVNGSVNQSSNSGKVSNGKTVSLLSNSLTKHSHSSTSLSSLSSLPSCGTSSDKTSPSQPSQKVVVISGTNSVVQQAPQLSAESVNSNNKCVENTGVESIAVPGVMLSKSHTPSSQNRFLLHDCVTLCSVGDNLMTSIPQENTCSTTVVPSSLSVPQDTKPQVLQPKFVLNEMNTLSSLANDDEFHQVISSVTGETIVTRRILPVKTDDLTTVNAVSNNSADEMANTDINSGGHRLILTLPNGEPLRITSNETCRKNNIVYAFSNEEAAHENVFFTVDPSSMLVTSYNGDQMQETAAVGTNDTSSSQVLDMNGVNEVNSSHSIKTVQVVNGNTAQGMNLEDSSNALDDLKITGNPAVFLSVKNSTIPKVQHEQIQMAAICNGDDTEDIGPRADIEANGDIETGVDSVTHSETVQLPATNIYQTEDGLILIQNPDGTTLQLQGSDGQALSVETVQALLGINLESDSSQLIT